MAVGHDRAAVAGDDEDFDPERHYDSDYPHERAKGEQ